MMEMSRAQRLMKGISEIGFYGQHNDYSTKQYDQDAGEYFKPFSDIQLPDHSGEVGSATTNQQTGQDMWKENEPGDKVS